MLGCRKTNKVASGTSARSVVYDPNLVLEDGLLITGQKPNSSNLEGTIRDLSMGRPVLEIIVADYAHTGNTPNGNTDGIIHTAFSQMVLYQAITQACGQETP